MWFTDSSASDETSAVTTPTSEENSEETTPTSEEKSGETILNSEEAGEGETTPTSHELIIDIPDNTSTETLQEKIAPVEGQLIQWQ